MIKIMHGDNLEKGFVKLELRRYLTSEQLDLHGFKMTLFKNGDQEYFCCSFVTST